MEHWLFTQLKRNGVDNNITMNGPWKYDADIEQFSNSQSNLITIRIQDHFLGEVGMTRKNLYKDDKLHDNEQGYKVWGNAIKDQVKFKINY
jgi:lysophospholipase L1-like esterase